MISGSIHLLNTGWLVGGILVLAGIIAGRESRLTDFPPYTRHERGWQRLQLLALLALVIASVFTPLANHSGWIAAGVAIYAAGAAIYGLALRAFARTPTGELVTRGVFQLNRNPIYTGQTLMLIGVGIAGASITLIALAVGFGLLADRLVRAEERLCAESFGDDYRAYAARVPRWVRKRITR